MESKAHSSLHPSYHHQITYTKFNLKIHYPPSFECEIWHYDQANVDHISKIVDLFPWEKALQNLNIDNMNIKNVISSCIPHETLIVDDRDPSWINKKAKQLIAEKNEIDKRYVKEKTNPKIFDKFKCLQNELNSIIETIKQKYYSRLLNKLIDPMTSPKVAQL